MGAKPFRVVPDDGPAPVEPPNPTAIIPSPGEPLPVARVLLDERTDSEEHLLLLRWRDAWWEYSGPQWIEADPEAIRKWLYERLEQCVYETAGKEGEVEYKSWSPDKGKLDKLLDAMAAPALLDRSLEAPLWLSSSTSAAGLVPCLNGLVDVTNGKTLPLTPDYFGTVAIPFDYDPTAGEPVEWLRFLRSLWPGRDPDEIRALRQWFGYVLSGRLELQKMLLLVGPPRCGKGTIARILTDLVGKANTSNPTLAGMATNFGLETTIGKSLSVVGDARLGSQGQEAVVERLLSISGQDGITLDRKNKPAWTGTLQTRMMILSNDLPKFMDASGAIASRFVIIRFEESFLGREDIELGRRLQPELPAILKWALDGLVDLNRTGRLYEPKSHQVELQEMYDLVSPISAFARDVCTVDPNEWVPFSTLYHEYETWCRENTRGITNTARFSADLKSSMPSLKTDYRPRNEEGQKLPRHVKGLTISDEWKTRVRDTTGDRWHMQEPPDHH